MRVNAGETVAEQPRLEPIFWVVQSHVSQNVAVTVGATFIERKTDHSIEHEVGESFPGLRGERLILDVRAPEREHGRLNRGEPNSPSVGQLERTAVDDCGYRDAFGDGERAIRRLNRGVRPMYKGESAENGGESAHDHETPHLIAAAH
jgi:hypothetical protein